MIEDLCLDLKPREHCADIFMDLTQPLKSCHWRTCYMRACQWRGRYFLAQRAIERRLFSKSQ